MTLVGLYASHTGRKKIFNKVIKKIEQCSEECLIIMGDFNSVSDMTMDKSGNPSYHSEMPKEWKEWLKNPKFVDRM